MPVGDVGSDSGDRKSACILDSTSEFHKDSLSSGSSPVPGTGVLRVNDTPLGLHFTSVDFVNAQTGFVAGAANDIRGQSTPELWVTVDGGRTWVTRPAPAGDPFSYIRFISADEGFAYRMNNANSAEGRAELWRTLDAGRTWHMVAANAVQRAV